MAFQAPLSWGQELPLSFVPEGRKAVLAGGAFYSCLLSAKNKKINKNKTIALSPANTSVSWKQMCFHLTVWWEETGLIRFPGLVLVDRIFLLMSL